MAHFGADAPLLLSVYRCTFDLLRSDVFTASAMHRAVPYIGYRADEIDAALELLVEQGHLALAYEHLDDLAFGRLYMAGHRHPHRTDSPEGGQR